MTQQKLRKQKGRNIFVSKSKLTNSQIIDTRPGMQALGGIMLIQCMMCDEQIGVILVGPKGNDYRNEKCRYAHY